MIFAALGFRVLRLSTFVNSQRSNEIVPRSRFLLGTISYHIGLDATTQIINLNERTARKKWLGPYSRSYILVPEPWDDHHQNGIKSFAPTALFFTQSIANVRRSGLRCFLPCNIYNVPPGLMHYVHYPTWIADEKLPTKDR